MQIELETGLKKEELIFQSAESRWKVRPVDLGNKHWVLTYTPQILYFDFLEWKESPQGGMKYSCRFLRNGITFLTYSPERRCRVIL